MRFPHFLTYNNCLSALSGALTAISFYSEHLSFLVFFSLVPLFYTLAYDFKLKNVFVYLMFYYSLSIIWLCNSVTKITENVFFLVILSFILIELISLILSVVMLFPFSVFRLVSVTQKTKLFLFPVIYILGEWLQGNILPITFPWIRLGNIASDFTLFIQSASLLGTLFISLLIMYINLLTALILKNIKNRNALVFSGILAVIVCSDICYGLYRINRGDNNISSEMTAIIVQGNYPKRTKFKTHPDEVLKKYLTLLCSLQDRQADLIVLPETSIHSKAVEKKQNLDMMAAICEKYDALMIFGSQHNIGDKSYNACMTIDSGGTADAAYLKRVLVPIGEYNPMSLITGECSEGDFSVGTECRIINSHGMSVGCAICFESVYPNIVSEGVKNGAEIITVLTNDSWLGKIIPLYQHHSHSVMRAVENDRYVLTSTNTGISSVIDNHGKIITKSKSNTEDVIAEGFYPKKNITLYTKWGDIIILPSCFIILFFTVRYLFGRIYEKISKSA